MRALAMVLSVMSLFTSATGELFVDTGPESILALVNRDHRIPYTYEPHTLVLPQVQAAPNKDTAIYLRPEAATALEMLFAAAAAEAGHTLYAVSGYRSYGLQKTIFNRKVEAVGEKAAMRTVAPAGASEHQLGLAMDINGEATVSLGLVTDFGASPEGLWIAENAHRFGFIIRYQPDTIDITGYSWEPWHLRYIGIDAAIEVYELGVTLEEYIGILQQRNVQVWMEPEAGEGNS